MARNTLAPGGYIGGEPPRRPYFNQLSGVWKLEDAVERQKAGTWANPLGIEDLFSTYLYTGNGSTQTITNGIDLAGKGGMVWIKSRSESNSDNNVSDTQRGDNATIKTNTTAAQTVFSSSFGIQHLSTGFTVKGSNNSFDGRNNTGQTYASWTFRKQAKFFDVVTYTGNGSNRTIAHNLGSVPGCIIVKRTDTADDWVVYHRSLTSASYVLLLNTTNAQINAGAGPFNSTAPTSSVFSLGPDFNTNASGGTYVAYLFAHDAGGFGDSGNESVIKCGSFTGAGYLATTTIDLGWEPQWILAKRTDTVQGWVMFDNMRGMDYTSSARLQPNTSGAEASFDSTGYFRPTPTGFTYGPDNYMGDTAQIIYIAIRRGPMKTPTDATKVFKAVTQTSQGTASTDFPVDMVIMGDRSSTWGYNWSTQDRLRGKSAVLFTSATTAENTTSLSTFDSNTSFKDGWVSGGTSAIYETFRRAPGFFDVVAYTGTGAVRTVAHNLGVAPELMIVKRRSSSGSDWWVYAASRGATKSLRFTNESEFTLLNIWNNTAPTTSVFTVGGDSAVNGSSSTYIWYGFSSCPGVSKVGNYTGTGTTLSIDCGFTAGARFVLIKRTDSTGDWYVWDTARGIVSGNDPYLLLNSTAAEVTSTDYIDPLSSGFQISSTAPAAINANGGSFIFLAIA